MNSLMWLATELRSPIQPILGLSEILRYGKRGGESNNSKLSKEDEQVLDIIIRNARRLAPTRTKHLRYDKNREQDITSGYGDT